MNMISISDITDKQFERARELLLPVTALDEHIYSTPSATRPAREHVVRFDRADAPQEVSCTCEVGQAGQPCWAMARAFDEHRLRMLVADAEDPNLALIRGRLRAICALAQEVSSNAVLDQIGRFSWEAMRALDAFEQGRLIEQFAMGLLIQEAMA